MQGGYQPEGRNLPCKGVPVVQGEEQSRQLAKAKSGRHIKQSEPQGRKGTIQPCTRDAERQGQGGCSRLFEQPLGLTPVLERQLEPRTQSHCRKGSTQRPYAAPV